MKTEKQELAPLVDENRETEWMRTELAPLVDKYRETRIRAASG
jgi:hypothetical protein